MEKYIMLNECIALYCLRKIVILVAILGMTLPVSHACRAELVIQVGDGSPLVFVAGTTALIPVYGYNSIGTSPINMNGYDLAFDVGPPTGLDGIGIPSVLSNFTADFSNSALGQIPGNFYIESDPINVSADPNPGYDLAIGNFNSTSYVVPTSASQPSAELFTLSFFISPSASGTYFLAFVPGATTGGISSNNFAGTGLAQNGGFLRGTGPNLNQFTVAATAVPEPSALIFTLCAGLIGLRQRYRRRKNLGLMDSKSC